MNEDAAPRQHVLGAGVVVVDRLHLEHQSGQNAREPRVRVLARTGSFELIDRDEQIDEIDALAAAVRKVQKLFA